MQFDMEKLSSELESYPNLEDFSSDSAAVQGQDERAIASLINLEKMYNGSSFLEDNPYHSVQEVSGAQLQIESFTESDEKAFGDLSSGGSTEEAVAAETSDAAESAGLFTSAAGGVFLSILPLAGTLAYQDITTGTNFITQAITSSIEDNKTVEERGGVGAEGMRWVRPRVLSNSVSTGDSILKYYQEKCYPETSFSGCGEKELEEHKEKNAYVPAGRSSEIGPVGTGKPDYYLEPKVGGWWYDNGSQGCFNPLSNPSGLTSKWIWRGCETPEIESVSGYPSVLEHVATETITGIPVFQPGFACTSAPFERGCPGGGQEYDATLGVRAPSRMHMNLPKHSTKSEVEKLEGEGHHFDHFVGTVPSKETEPEVVKKLATKLKEHGNRRQEQFECHYLECELEYFEPQPETGLEPPLPEKSPESLPSIPGTELVPSCFVSSMTGMECVELLKDDGFSKVELDTVTWEHAVVSKPANAVIKVTPGAGSTVETTVTIAVEQNPEIMPAVVPDINTGKETGTEYKERLEREGWTDVHVGTLSEIATDPSIGPDQASYTVPSEGSLEDPCMCTRITVEQNPEDAPEPSEGSSGIGPPTLPGFKIPNFGVLCKGFPFGVPCWLIKTIESWSAASVCPDWHISEFEIHSKKIPEVKVNLCSYGLEPIMEKARIAMLIFSTLGLVLLFYRFAKGGSPPSGGGIPDHTSVLNESDEGVYL